MSLYYDGRCWVYTGEYWRADSLTECFRERCLKKGFGVKGLPNYLTCLRLLLVPVFVILMADPTKTMVRIATVVFVVAALTDYLDGIIARRYQAVSDFGKLVDPLADKLLVMSALVMLVAQRSDVYGLPWVPGWMVVLVLAREIWVTGLRAVAAAQGNVLAASSAGKAKSLLQMTAIVLLLLHDARFTILGFAATCEFAGVYLLLISIGFSYWGAIEYSLSVLKTAKHAQTCAATVASSDAPPALSSSH